MKKKFKIEWMTCASCVIVNENSLNDLKWVTKVSINLATNIASIEYDENDLDFSDIKKEIESNWFKVNENIEEENTWNKKDNKILNRFIFSAIFSLPVFSMMFGDFMTWILYIWVDLTMWIYFILSFIVVFIFWWHFHKSAFKSLSKFHFTMDSLVSLWTLVAFIYSSIVMFFNWMHVYFEAAVAIITLINLWKYLEHRAKSKAWDAIWKLLELWSKKANVISWMKIVEKDIDDIKVWEVIVVKAWEKIALDWIVLMWSANVDESMLTWESVPVYKEKDNECFAWTINQDWSINIKVTKINKESTLSNIIKMVDEAQSSKAPIQHLADKISSIFVPTIIIISIFTFIWWYIYSGSLEAAIVASVASLVIACPCALWLATPTAIMVWTWVWAKNWILIKNAETLEKSKDINVVVFDKTWTLTNWKPELIDIISFKKQKEEIELISKSISSLSNHPLSKTIVKIETKFDNLEIKNFEEIKGKWLKWELNWKEIFIWNKKLFKNISNDIIEKIEELNKQWKTVNIVWDDTEIYGLLVLMDVEKIWVEKIIAKLYSMKIEVVMLTWDSLNTANFIANKIWIDKVIAEVMPEDKLNVIKDLQAENKKVAFVWDWINDAPALVQADLSIAIWTWSDIAIESSDIVLIKWNISKVVSAIELSRKTLRIIKQNLFWAFVYNSIWIPLAVFWILNPIFASFAMSMSSVSVITNSLRLKMFK